MQTFFQPCFIILYFFSRVLLFYKNTHTHTQSTKKRNKREDAFFDDKSKHILLVSFLFFLLFIVFCFLYNFSMLIHTQDQRDTMKEENKPWNSQNNKNYYTLYHAIK